MKLYLDDERESPVGWIRVHNVPTLIHMIKNHPGEVDEISLDHDLGDGEMTGYDFMRWLESQVFLGSITCVPKIVLHTANPVGRKNMQLVIDSISRKLSEPKET